MMHIALTIDSKFVRYCAVTIVSILENNGKCPKSEVLGIYRLTYRRFLSILKIINP